MTQSETDLAHARFKTYASLLIAAVTLVSALVAWRISVATGAAGGADSDGLAAALLSSDTSTHISTYLNGYLGFFADYRQHIDMAQLLEQDAAATTDAARQVALTGQAVAERNLAARDMAALDQDYVKTDTATGKQTFDANQFWNTQWAQARAQQDLDSAPYFSKADVKRNKARGLVGVTVLFSAALLLLTASTTTRHWTKFMLLGTAVPVFLVGVLIVLVLEMVW
jgi:hypothetical protein